MAKNTLVQRIALDGGEDIKAELQALGATGERVFRQLQRAADQLKGPSQGFIASLKAVQKQLDAVGAQYVKVGQKIRSAGTTLTKAITLPIAGAGTAVLKFAGDFEASANSFAANAEVAGAQLDAAKQKALELGRVSVFSGGEVLDGMTELAKVGLSYQQIMGGAAQATITLAAANDTQLGPAAAAVGDVIKQFNLDVSKLPDVVNKITGALVQSKLGFEDYQQAIAQAGGAAGALGVSFDDLNAVLAATATSFGSGSDAGTSFKTFLQRLVPQGKEAADIFDELNLQFFDSSGRMKSMSQIAQELKTKLAGLSQKDLNEKLGRAFGTDAIRTALALMKLGGAGIDDMKAKLADTKALDIADARIKGFNGSLKKLGSALYELGVAIGDSGVLQFATDLVSKLRDLVAALSKTNPELTKWGTITAGIVATVGPLLAGLGLMIAGWGRVYQAIASVIGIMVALGATPLGITVAVVAAIGAGLALWATRFDEGTRALGAQKQAVNEIDKAYDQVGRKVDQLTQKQRESALVALTVSQDKTRQALADELNSLRSFLEQRIKAIDAAVAKAGDTPLPDSVKNFLAFEGALKDFVAGGSIDQLAGQIAHIGASNPALALTATQFQALIGKGADLSKSFQDNANHIALYTGAITDAEFASRQAALGIEGYVGAAQNAGAASQKAADGVKQIGEASQQTITVLRNGQKEIYNLSNGIVTGVQKSKDALDEVGNSASKTGKKVKQAADDISSSFRQVPQAAAGTQPLKPLEDSADQTATKFQQVGQAATDAGKTVEQAAPAAGQAWQQAGDQAKKSLAELPTVAKTAVDGVQAEIDRLNQSLQTVGSAASAAPAQGAQDQGQEAAKGGQGGIAGIFDQIRQTVSDTVDQVITALSRIQPAAQDAFTGLGQLAGKAAEDILTAFDGLSGSVESVFSAIVASIQSQFNSLETAVQNLVSSLTAKLNDLRQAIASAKAQASGSSDSGSSDFSFHFAGGGAVFGPGGSKSDSILARLSNGEFVLRAEAVKKFGLPFLNALNALKLPGFAEGGAINLAGYLPNFAGLFSIPTGLQAFASVPNIGQIGAGIGDHRPVILQMPGGLNFNALARVDAINELGNYLRSRNFASLGAAPSWQGAR